MHPVTGCRRVYTNLEVYVQGGSTKKENYNGRVVREKTPFVRAAMRALRNVRTVPGCVVNAGASLHQVPLRGSTPDTVCIIV